MAHQLPALPYAYDALEPHIDARTMEIHHTKHHQTYVTKLNEALEKQPELRYQHASALKTQVETIANGTGQGEARNPKSEFEIEWTGLAQVWAVLSSLLVAAVVLGWFLSDKSFSLLACLGAVLVVTSVVVLLGAWLVLAIRRSLAGPMAGSGNHRPHTVNLPTI